MKKLLIISLAAAAFCSNTSFAQSLKFSITGEIEGIQKGDTLHFEKILLPSFESEPAFDIIVDKNGSFKYNGTHPHTQYYAIQYRPIGAPVEDSNKKSIEIIIKDGTIRIEGRRDYIYYSKVTNSFYDKDFAKIQELSDSLDMAQNMIYNAMSDKTQDTKITLELYNKYSSFTTDNASHYQRLDALRKAYDGSAKNEYKAYELCTRFTYPLKKLEEGYNQLDSKGRKSYYGTVLNSIIEKLRTLSPDQPAPDFKLGTRDEGRTVSLADFKGKYLFIYFYGTSYSSIESDKYIVDLYKRNADTLEVIGITESQSLVNQAFDNLIINGSPDMKKGITSMLVHPWKYKVNLEEGKNRDIVTTYNVTGIPFFILISPDGKIVARGFFEAFNKANAVLNALSRE